MSLDLQGRIQLRASIQQRIQQASRTLIWFANQVERERVPPNTWLKLDRPLPRRSQTLGPAFDVWHAILRAERTLRLGSRATAGELRKAAESIRKKVEERTKAPSKDPATQSAYARRLVSDEVYGTFNALSAASVLRSEVFPERSVTTPSYLAGHILFSELAIASNKGKSHSAAAIRDRFPRLFVIAQGVHSVMLYVELLRRRATLFDKMAKELRSLKRLSAETQEAADRESVSGVHGGNGAQDTTGLKPVSAMRDGYTRLAMARLSSCCGESEDLLVSTRDFFKVWRAQLDVLVATEKVHLKPEDVDVAFANAVQTLRESTPLEQTLADQQSVHEYSQDFSSRLYVEIKAVRDALANVFSEDTRHGFDALRTHLTALQAALQTLEQTHLADTKPGEYPSIRDAARFQFAKMLVGKLSKGTSPHRVLYTLDEMSDLHVAKRVRAHLEQLGDECGLEMQTDGKQSVAQAACDVIRRVGMSPMGRGVLEWWDNYVKCYDPRTGPRGDATSWMSLRHRSFQAIDELIRAIKACQVSDQVLASLTIAAEKERGVANEIENMIKGCTQWCIARGHQLLLSGRNETPPTDPLELASALWIADRIGEPWNATLEQEAFEVIQKLQRADGGFGAVAPLCQNRGFAYYLPSASTIGLVARFVTKGTAAPRQQTHRDRLRRWAPVLEKGAMFLVNSMVVSSYDSGQQMPNELPGWHSDRHPERERIDCLATTEAITALCRLDDALRWLVNLETIGDFRTVWPQPALAGAIPTDCEAPLHEQLLPKILPLIRRLKSDTASYTTGLTDPVARFDQRAFVFYGPPGTGKTYAQQLIAGELGWPLVTLTIGDFLHEGEDKVGRRAEDIFKRLSMLSNACIVFDEFDEMVTVRSRKGEQGWAGFPLLTATMLPLLSNLRDQARAQSCAISFTTNYIENIDQAATRGGRVDDRVLLTYPDYASRLLLGVTTAWSLEAPVDWSLLNRIAAECAFSTYPDVREYIERIIRRANRPEPGIEGQPWESRAPKTPIDPSYYGDLENAGSEITHGMKRLFDAIGSKDDQEIWLGQHKEWVPVWTALKRDLAVVERRRQWRRDDRVKVPVSLGDNKVARIVDFSDGGVRLLVVSDVDITEPSLVLKVSGGPHVSVLREWSGKVEGTTGRWVFGARIDPASAEHWRAVIAEWKRPEEGGAALSN